MATQTITKENIEQTIDDNDIVILDFWAEWCGPCKSFAPVFEAASAENEDIVFGKVDTEDQGELAAGLQITSIPTVMVFREGVLLYRQPGALPPGPFKQLIEQVRDIDMDDVREKLAEQEQQAQGDQA